MGIRDRLKRKVTGVDKSMESKNKTLETQTDDTQKETSKVWNWIPALAAAGAGAAALGKSLEDNLGSFKMPDWELPDFGGYSLPSPVFSPAVAPAIDMSSLFQPSVRENQRHPDFSGIRWDFIRKTIQYGNFVRR